MFEIKEIISKALRLSFVELGIQDPLPANCSMCNHLEKLCAGHRRIPASFGQFRRTNAIAFAFQSDSQGKLYKIRYFSEKKLKLPSASQEIQVDFKKVELLDTIKTKRTQIPHGIHAVMNRSCDDQPMRMFLKEVLTMVEFQGSVIIGRGKWLNFAFRELLTLKANPQPTRRGKILIMIDVKLNQLKLLSLDAFLGHAFEVDGRTAFPWSLNFSHMYNYIGNIPDFKYFCSRKHTTDSAQHIRRFIEDFHGKWNFPIQLATVLSENVMSLMEKSFRVQDIGLEIQSALKKDAFPDLKLTSCFNYTTWATYFYVLMQNCSLKHFPIYVCKNPETGPKVGMYLAWISLRFDLSHSCFLSHLIDITSRIEFIYQKFYEWKHPKNKLEGTFLSGNAGKKFGRKTVDLWDSSLGHVVELFGCVVHG